MSAVRASRSSGVHLIPLSQLTLSSAPLSKVTSNTDSPSSTPPRPLPQTHRTSAFIAIQSAVMADSSVDEPSTGGDGPAGRSIGESSARPSSTRGHPCVPSHSTSAHPVPLSCLTFHQPTLVISFMRWSPLRVCCSSRIFSLVRVVSPSELTRRGAVTPLENPTSSC